MQQGLGTGQQVDFKGRFHSKRVNVLPDPCYEEAEVLRSGGGEHFA